jgi:hypothetical protein
MDLRFRDPSTQDTVRSGRTEQMGLVLPAHALPAGEALQHLVPPAAGLAQLGDAALDPIHMPLDQGGHMRTRRLADISDGQPAADLGQAQPGGLSLCSGRPTSSRFGDQASLVTPPRNTGNTGSRRS